MSPPSMLLHWSPRSPFVRKVMISAYELGLVDQIERRRSVVSMSVLNHDLLAYNPLGKIPTLVLGDGTVIADSLVICEYFDALVGGGRLIPAQGMARLEELTLHALANGWLESLVLWQNELQKPATARTTAWLEVFSVKTISALEYFELKIAVVGIRNFGVALITLGCCLSYLDFRLAFIDWRSLHPQLTAWYENFKDRPSSVRTEVVDDR